MAARMPTIATAIMSAISEKPFFTLVSSRSRMLVDGDDRGGTLRRRCVQHQIDDLPHVQATRGLFRRTTRFDPVGVVIDFDLTPHGGGGDRAGDQRRED